MKVKNKYFRWVTLSVTALAAINLVGCSNNAATNHHAHFSAAYRASKPATKAGDHSTLKVGEVSSSPFTGIASPELQSSSEDGDVFSPGGSGSLFNNNRHYKITNGGLADLKLNKANNTATIKLRKNARWSNGEKVIAKDVEYPYEIIANKKSQSQQFSNDMEDIKGLKDYHDGKVNHISGITFPNGPQGRMTVIHYYHIPPAVKYNGNGFMWGAVEPYNYIKNIPINKLQSSTKVRKHPIFIGPYKLKKEVSGESTSWVPNKYYYGKTPRIKRIDIQVTSPDNFTAALKSKKYDFTFGAPDTQYPRIKALKDYSEVGQPELGYSFLGFNVGKFSKNGYNITSPHAKMNNVNLRKAMLYALDLNLVAKKFGNGISYRGNTLIPPVFGKYHSSYDSQPGFPYNMKKAKELLKSAGYQRRNGSHYVTSPSGKKLIIHFGAMQGSSTASAQEHYFMQQWHKLGLDVKFTTGRPMEANRFYSMLQKPNQHVIDVFEASFGVNSDPTPTVGYGPQSTFNWTHFATKKENQLLNEMNDKKSFNLKYRIKIFKEWEKYMNQTAVYAPEFYSSTWTAVNHRVTGYDQSPANGNFWGDLGLNSTVRK